MVKKNRKRMLGIVLTMVWALLSAIPVMASETAQMVLKTDNNYYEAGSTVTAHIYIYDASFNAAGFSIQYNTARMTPVTDDGVKSDNIAQIVRIHDPYDDESGTGTFSILNRTLDTDKGTVTTVAYVNPQSGKTAIADTEGLLVAEISFEMLEDGEPDIAFTISEDSVDFYAVPCLIVDGGTQMESARATVQYGEDTVQTTDISQSVIEKVDEEQEKARQESEADQTVDSEETQSVETDHERDVESMGTDNESRPLDVGEEQTDTKSSDVNPKELSEDNRIPYIIVGVILVAAIIAMICSIKRKKNNKGDGV